MKALSIIGMVFSLLLLLLSFAVIDIHCYDQWGSSQPGLEIGLIIFILAAFFLAFSIVACVFAFKKKKA
ncbi:MAG: hypothetical protein IPP64_04830 [Bacteroidetes bacterium]|nr:hypothetical protein [Bacteroidota bacterium]